MAEKFGDPDVSSEVVDLVIEVAGELGPVEPWVILQGVVDEGVDRRESRRALRKLRLSNRIVPAGDFVGEVRLVEE